MGNLIFDKLVTPSANNTDEEDFFQLEKSLFLPILKILAHKRAEEQIKDLLEAVHNYLRDIQLLKMEKKRMSGSIGQIRTELESQLSEIQYIIPLVDRRSKKIV